MFFSILKLLVPLWVVLFACVGLIATMIGNEFLGSAIPGIWVAWLVGIPLATATVVLVAPVVVLWFIFKKGKPTQTATDREEREKKAVFRATVAGGIAAVAAMFANINPFGIGYDFTLTNLTDCVITATLTIAMWRRKAWAGLVLFLYYTLWKMTFWPYLQPKGLLFAGVIISLLFWNAFLATWENRNKSE